MMVLAADFGPFIMPRALRGRRTRQIFDKHVQAATAEAAVRLRQRLVKTSLNVQSLGTMAASWQIDPPQPVKRGRVHETVVKATGPGGIEALVWDKGTITHPRPPTRQGDPLRRWVRVKLGLQGAKARRTAFAIARDIQRRGLPNPANSGRRKVGMFTREDRRFRKTELPKIITKHVDRLTRELGRK